jgi:hypothetical protein
MAEGGAPIQPQKGCGMDVTIAAEQGTHLLITCGDRFAAIEQRNSRLYNCHDGRWDGIPLTDLPMIAKILDERDWADQATTQSRTRSSRNRSSLPKACADPCSYKFWLRGRR